MYAHLWDRKRTDDAARIALAGGASGRMTGSRLASAVCCLIVNAVIAKVALMLSVMALAVSGAAFVMRDGPGDTCFPTASDYGNVGCTSKGKPPSKYGTCSS